MLLLLLACSAAADNPLLSGQPVALAPWMGSVTFGPAMPGSYALTLSTRSHAYITLERTIWEGVTGTASLILREDGTFTACLQHDRTSGSTVSRYASDDGEDHRDEHTSSQQRIIDGGWAREGDWIVLTAKEGAWSTCLPDTERFPISGDFRCLGLSGGVLPRAGLGCVEGEGSLLSHLTLPIGPTDSEPRMPDLHPPGQRWLLLGGPTMELRWSDEGRPDAAPTLEFQ